MGTTSITSKIKDDIIVEQRKEHKRIVALKQPKYSKNIAEMYNFKIFIIFLLILLSYKNKAIHSTGFCCI